MNTHRFIGIRGFFVRSGVSLALVAAGLVTAPMILAPTSADAQVNESVYDVDARYRTARTMFERGDLNGSEKIFRDIIRIQPSHTGSRAYLAQIDSRRANKPQITLAHHLSAIVVPEVSMEDFTFRDAVKYLRIKVPELLKKEGKDVNVNFVVFDKDGLAEKEISNDLVMKNIPASELIRYLCSMAGFRAVYRGDIVEFRPLVEE